jgi:hypothetical protein
VWVAAVLAGVVAVLAGAVATRVQLLPNFIDVRTARWRRSYIVEGRLPPDAAPPAPVLPPASPDRYGGREQRLTPRPVVRRLAAQNRFRRGAALTGCAPACRPERQSLAPQRRRPFHGGATLKSGASRGRNPRKAARWLPTELRRIEAVFLASLPGRADLGIREVPVPVVFHKQRPKVVA